MRNLDPILLVEDDLLDVMTIKRGFQEIHAENPLYICHDGEAGIKFLEDSQTPTPALIILDLNMPRMNGIEFLKILKTDPNWCKIPVVILTTSKEDSDRIASFELSVAGYIVKSLEYSAFVDKLFIIYQYWRLNEIS